MLDFGHSPSAKPQDTDASLFAAGDETVIDTADLLSEMGRSAEAFTMLQEAQAKKPTDTDLLFRLSVGHFENNDFAKALGWADKILQAERELVGR